MMLHVSKLHLYFLPIMETRVEVFVAHGYDSGHIPGFFKQAAINFFVRHVWTAPLLQWALPAIGYLRAVTNSVVSRPACAWRLQCPLSAAKRFTARAAVFVL